MNHKGFAVILILIITICGMFQSILIGQDTVLTVTYGNQASTREGDHDFTQVILFSVPAETGGNLFLRVFDPDCGGKIDQRIGTFDTSTRFRIFGGVGVFSRFKSWPFLPPDNSIAKLLERLEPSQTIADKTFSINRFYDNRWFTFDALAMDKGELVNGRYYFALLIQGMDGDDGNIYDVFVSSQQTRNILPKGLEMVCPSTTVHVPQRDTTAEIRFITPPEAREITVHNFDAAGAMVDVRTAFRSGLRVKTSSQGEWEKGIVSLEKNETGTTNAVALKGGNEFPNDATFYITANTSKSKNENNRLPLRFPVLGWKKTNNRPVPCMQTLILQDCKTVVFDAAPTVDPDRDALNYKWQFGDGSSAEGIRVSHAYETGGSFTVRLMVTDSSGQVSNSARITEHIRINIPPVAVAGENITAAPGEIVSFDASKSNDPDGIISKYIWHFGDAPGSGSSPLAQGKRVSHTYTKPGLYKVNLQVIDDSGTPCQSGRDTLDVFINAAPRIEIGKNLSGSPREAIEFDGSNCFDSDGEIVRFLWDFGDGRQQEGRIVRHEYAKPGTYKVVLTIRDDSGATNDFASDSLDVFINDRPVAKAGDYRKVSVGQTVRFDGTQSTDSDGSIDRFDWELGDGTEKQGRMITHSYAKPGTYKVQLTVRDNSRTSSDLSKDSLQIDVNFPPVARAGDDITVTRSTVQLDGSQSTDQDDQLKTYDWDFGDGETGSGVKIAHTYAKPGTYSVKLTVTDTSGTSTASHSDRLTVTVNEKPVAHAGKDILTAPGEKVVLDGSKSSDPDGHIKRYLWNLGDGTDGQGRMFTHTYKQPGVYHVSLMVQDNTGHEEAVGFDHAIVTVNAQPAARAGETVSAAPGRAVTFDGSRSFDSDGKIIRYTWTFSDGQTSGKMKTVRTFKKPGIYTATLTVTDDSGVGNGTASEKVYVKINHRPRAFPGKDMFVCNPTVALDGSLSADADGDLLHYTWNFADGTPPAYGRKVVHTFKKSGAYPVVLTVDDRSGLSNARHSASVNVVINHPPIAEPGRNKTVCAGKPVIFDAGNSSDPDNGLLKYRWDFGDGTTYEGVNPVKTFKEKGIYTVVLNVKDDSGLPCGEAFGSLTVTVIDSPIARAGDDQVVCVGDTVRLDGSESYDSDGVVNRFEWDFGDGTTGGGATPTHIYSAPGIYRVLLTITGDKRGDCQNTDSDDVLIRVVEAPVAVIQTRDIAPVDVAVMFDGSQSTGSGSPILSWDWDFGDGETGSGKTVSHRFEKHGTYFVSLTVRTGTADKCGTSSVRRFITINSPPKADAGIDLHVGVNQPVVLSGRGSKDLDGAITSYAWNLGDGTKAVGLQVRHKYEKSGVYDISLTVTDDSKIENGTDVHKIKIRVNNEPVPVIIAPERGSTGMEIRFDGMASSDADGDLLKYSWDFGDGKFSDQPRPAHTFIRPGPYRVSLTVDDGLSLSNSQAETTREIVINHPPVARVETRISGCVGEPVQFDAGGSRDPDGKIVSYNWDFGDGSEAKGPSPRHTYTKAGIYPAVLTVTDDSGTLSGRVPVKITVIIQASPMAKITAKDHCYCGGAHDGIVFCASRSSAGDGRPLVYTWNFGDGQTASGVQVFHAFKKPGIYAVKLTVSDKSGSACGTGMDTLTVTVTKRDKK